MMVNEFSPLLISHRGVRLVHSENTLGAFKAATGAGFRALETDLRATKDGEVVLCHDRVLLRLAADPRAVDSLTRKELESVRLRCGGRLMFLDEFVTEFSGCRWTFDIKPETGCQVVNVLASRFSKVLDNAKFLFWSRKQEDSLRVQRPGVSCYARERLCWVAGLCVLTRVSPYFGIRAGLTYSLPYRALGRDWYREDVVARFHERRAKLLAFLPRNLGQFEKALEAGFDEILLDLPPTHLPKV